MSEKEVRRLLRRKAVELNDAIEDARRLGLAVDLDVFWLDPTKTCSQINAESVLNCIEVRPYVAGK